MDISETRKQVISNFVQEFRDNYFITKTGQWHISEYKRERTDVRKFWEEIKLKKARNLDYSDDVLEKMLPYANTKHNREKGYRISVMPAITKDLKIWFENVGWQKHENWPKVGEAIFQLFYEVIENENYNAFAEFESKYELAKGLKSGFISPSLFFLNSKYRIINNKTILTVHFILERQVIGRDLSNYMKYVSVIDEMITSLGIDHLNEPEMFDMFCHYMCDKRLGGYAKYIGKSSREVETFEMVEEEIPIIENELEPSGHWEAIYYITQIGKLLGYKTFVADPSREAFGKKLGDIADLSEVPAILKTAPEIHRIDAIWYSHKPPFFFFEVEDGGTMREALHRLYNAMAFDARFFVVCPGTNHDKFLKWVTTAPFKEFEDRYNFRTYEELFDFYKEVKNYTEFREKFLRL
jgi:hypothetical protein